MKLPKVQYPLRMIIFPDGMHILINVEEQDHNWYKAISLWKDGFKHELVNQ